MHTYHLYESTSRMHTSFDAHPIDSLKINLLSAQDTFSMNV